MSQSCPLRPPERPWKPLLASRRPSAHLSAATTPQLGSPPPPTQARGRKRGRHARQMPERPRNRGPNRGRLVRPPGLTSRRECWGPRVGRVWEGASREPFPVPLSFEPGWW